MDPRIEIKVSRYVPKSQSIYFSLPFGNVHFVYCPRAVPTAHRYKILGQIQGQVQEQIEGQSQGQIQGRIQS